MARVSFHVGQSDAKNPTLFGGARVAATGVVLNLMRSLAVVATG
jgi:hypothetical protein